MSNRAGAERAGLGTGNALVKIHQLSDEAALGSLGSDTNGLSAAEGMRRLRECGPNRIEKIARTQQVDLPRSASP